MIFTLQQMACVFLESGTMNIDTLNERTDWWNTRPYGMQMLQNLVHLNSVDYKWMNIEANTMIHDEYMFLESIGLVLVEPYAIKSNGIVVHATHNGLVGVCITPKGREFVERILKGGK